MQVRRSAFSGTFAGDRQLPVTLQDTPGHAEVPDQSARSPVPLLPPGRQKLVEYWTCMVEGHPVQEIDVFRLDSQGRMTDQTVLLRPWPVVTLLRDRAMAGQLRFPTAS